MEVMCRVKPSGEGITQMRACMWLWLSAGPILVMPILVMPLLEGFTWYKNRPIEGEELFKMKLPTQKTKHVSSSPFKEKIGPNKHSTWQWRCIIINNSR